MITLLKTVALLAGRLTVKVYNEDNKSFYLTFRFIRQSSLTLTTQLYIDGKFVHGVLSGFSNSTESNLTLNIEQGLYSIASKTMEFDVSLYNSEREREDYGSEKFQITDLKLNTNPVISDIDRSLGDKNEAFSVVYQLSDFDNDTLTVVEKLNGNVLRTLNNAPKGQDLIINISRDQLYTLPLNVENKISIEVDDGKGGLSYRNYTFKRTNTAPVISNIDKNLGVIIAIGEKYTVNDMEGNTVTVVEKLNNTVLRSFAATLGKEYTTAIDKDTWIKLKNGPYTYSIEATDSNNSKSTRVFSFTKKETKIDFTLAKPFQTDIKASKILVTPSWELNGATAKVEACNNAFDANPTWEDITKQVLINRHYNFTNTAKTADKWGINIRIYIEKSQDAVNEVNIKGFGGAFE